MLPFPALKRESPASCGGRRNTGLCAGLSPKREFIADCWAEYRNNPTPRPIAKQIGERIDEVVEQKRKGGKPTHKSGAADYRKAGGHSNEALPYTNIPEVKIDRDIIPKEVHDGQQGKHIPGHNNNKPFVGIKSIMTENPQELLSEFISGKHRVIRTLSDNRFVVEFDRIIGIYYGDKGKIKMLSRYGMIKYKQDGTGLHMYPMNPEQY